MILIKNLINIMLVILKYVYLKLMQEEIAHSMKQNLVLLQKCLLKDREHLLCLIGNGTNDTNLEKLIELIKVI